MKTDVIEHLKISKQKNFEKNLIFDILSAADEKSRNRIRIRIRIRTKMSRIHNTDNRSALSFPPEHCE